MPLQKQFYVKVYMADNVLYKDGKTLPIYCNHTNLGNYSMNTVGQVTPLPEATILSSPPEIGIPAAGIHQGNIYPSLVQPENSGQQLVTKLKDMVMLSEYYVDTADYATKVIQCNPVQ